MSRIPLLFVATGLSIALVAAIPDASAQRRAHVRAGGATADGGYRAASGTTASGERGRFARGHAVESDGQGNVSGASGAAVQGANGGLGQRQGGFYRNADGSGGRQGSASIEGADGGAASSSGSMTRNTDGTYAGQRQTQATGKEGNSYSGSTSYDSSQGVQHTATCTDAAGNVIDCRGN